MRKKFVKNPVCFGCGHYEHPKYIKKINDQIENLFTLRFVVSSYKKIANQT